MEREPPCPGPAHLPLDSRHLQRREARLAALKSPISSESGHRQPLLPHTPQLARGFPV